MDAHDRTGAYTAADIQVLDTLTVLRRRPHMYLGTDKFSPEYYAGRVAAAALLCGATALVVERLDAPAGPWLIVRSDAEWLPAADPLSAFRSFVLILPVENAPHGMGHRPELCLAAYAADVATASGADGDLALVVVKGEADAALREHLESLRLGGQVGRLVAFRGAEPLEAPAPPPGE